MRPATPGFIVTLIATILLAVVSFSVPWFKSIYFLKASLAVQGIDIDGSITFGVLGYCLELSNGTTCSKATVGYELDINKLVGNTTKIQIPEVIVKWLTYALVLHIVALAFAATSAFFGLLAHFREFSMTCFSSCTAGVGAAITLLAFIFDLALFFLAKSRLNSVGGGSATIGNAIWLTLAAWLLLFFSGCFYGLGRCCIRRRPRDMARSDREGGGWVPAQSTGSTYEEQMRLDAVKAEADRKARLKQGELGLPAFPEHDPTQPLTGDHDDDAQPAMPYRDAAYAAAPPGTRAVDDYYNPSENNAYPPRRHPTALSDRSQQTGYIHAQQTSNYAPSGYGVPAAVSTGAAAGYLSPEHTGGYQHGQYPSQAASRYGHEQSPSNVGRRQPTGNADYAQSTFSPYDALPSRAAADNSGTDPFQAYTSPQQLPFDLHTYNATGQIPQPSVPSRQEPTSYYTPQTQAVAPPSRSYTLGGGGYGNSTVPDPEPSPGFLPYPGSETNTDSVYSGLETPASPRGPRERMASPSPVEYEDSPPMYDDVRAGASHVVSSKR
ncbi:SUR7/PalI family-domain-containing protein [Lactarius quietus]|nr:SUR7/PalI family-domain-containing protein [Lactarius quietus]